MTKFEKLQVNYKLDIDYSKLFETWYQPLSKMLLSDYMYNMMVFLHEGYKFKDIVPKKEHVFHVFRKIKYNDVRVIIIGEEPYKDDTNMGIPYGQNDSLVLNQEILEIQECIERTCYDKFNLNIDTRLNHWLDQGVLPLYSSLTGEIGIEGKHKYHWREFIRSIILNFNESKPGMIYMLWGDDANYFKQYINPNTSYILNAESVKDCIKNKKMWHTQNFIECNEIIEKCNGKELCIKW